MKELAEKFLTNSCTKAEAQKVLAWFQTSEGEAFLKSKLDNDIKELGAQETPIAKIQDGKNASAEPPKPKGVSYIHNHNNRHSKAGLTIKAAAAILVLALGIGLYWLFQPGVAKAQQKLYKAGANQQHEFTLADGTHVRLNQNSKLWVSKHPTGRYRKVRLQGEAYFKVTHNPQRPFEVITHHAVIRDIGTKFDVKDYSSGQNVQVAVIAGEVLFKSKKGPQEHFTHLTKGHFGFLNVKENDIKVNHFAVQNYLSWMNHRIVFIDAPMAKVGRQLERLYHIKCAFASSDLKNRRITADFTADSPKKVLSVIAQTLPINYRKDGNKVVWLAG